ncbi:MAG: T9SS type A sorting domain-containing protein [Candidatus Kapabacteria bacterium]|nr:T9SS type A sorting domain-containing protein [Candidatus Kapabacteria bacterium]
MLRWFGCVVLMLLASGSILAQKVELYWDDANKESRVISFGVIPSTIAVQRRVVLRNATSADVFVRTVRLNRQGTTSPIIDEFLVSPTTVTILQSQRRDTISINYNAAQLPQFVDTLVDVDLVVQVLDTLNGPVVESHTFRMLARKTPRALGTLDTWIAFDSVYVNSACAKRDTIPVSNLSTIGISIARQQTRVRTPYMGRPEIIVDTFPQLRIPERTDVSWKARYQPLDRGRDSADFVIVYSNPDNASDSVHVLQVSGIGVEQQIELQSLVPLSGGGDVLRRGRDTIDISNVAAGAGGITFGVVISNEGNVDIGVDSVRIAELGLPSPYLTVVRPFSSVIPVGTTDTMIVRFDADADLRHVADLLVHTNIARRGYGCVPDTARVRRFVVAARATSIFSITPELLDLGTLTTRKECTSHRLVGVFEVRNTSTTTAVIDSVTVTPSGTATRVSPGGFTIAAGGMVRLEVELSKNFTGTAEGLITLWSASGERRRTFRIRAAIAEPDTLSVEVPRFVSSRPGSIIAIPVIAKGYDARVLRSATVELTYDPQALVFQGAIRTGTASESAQVQAQSSPGRTRLRLGFAQDAPPSDTLVMLRFATFLADSFSTLISFVADTTEFGSVDCPRLYPLNISGGTYYIDSVCGLSYKTLSGRAFRAGVLPNPAQDVATIALSSAPGSAFTIQLVDALGRGVTDPMPVVTAQPLDIIPVDVSGVPPSTYTVLVRSADAVLSIPLVVRR